MDQDPTTRLVRRALEGDRDALDDVVKRLTPLLLCHVERDLGTLRSRIDAEDIVDEAWLVTLARLDSITPHERATPVLLSFLNTTARKTIHALRRKEVRRLRRHVDDSAVSRYVEISRGALTNLAFRELLDRTREAFASLDAHDRDVLDLYYYRELEVRAIAKQLDLSSSAVKMRLKRARERLRDRLPAGVRDAFELHHQHLEPLFEDVE